MPASPGPLLKRVLRVPTTLYGANAGWLLGHRFLELTHRGRRTGTPHRVVLEVVEWRPDAPEAVVMSGFGRDAQWYRNVRADPAVELRIGRERWPARARTLETDEAVAALAGYERRNRLAAPVVRAVLSRLAGFRYDGTDAARRRLVEALPLVAFRRDSG
jgi:deazaflavin-dependent oxidoreductase (nitroreductase family)